MSKNGLTPILTEYIQKHAREYICDYGITHITVGNELEGHGWYITLNKHSKPIVIAIDRWVKYYCKESDLHDIGYEYRDFRTNKSFTIKRAHLSNCYTYRDKFLKNEIQERT